MRYTDLADELYHAPEDALPAGVRVATAKRGGVTVTTPSTIPISVHGSVSRR